MLRPKPNKTQGMYLEFCKLMINGTKDLTTNMFVHGQGEGTGVSFPQAALHIYHGSPEPQQGFL